MRVGKEFIPPQLAEKIRLSSENLDDWDGILENGEVVIWQGAPVQRILFTAGLAISLGVGAVILVMAVMLYDMQSMNFTTETLSINGVKQTELPRWIATLSYFLFALGLLIPISVAKIGMMKRAQTFYTLTNKRAFVGKDFNKRRLLFHRFHKLSKIRKTGSKVGTVAFFFDWKKDDGIDYLVESGFDNIKDPAKVYALVLKAVQEAPET